MTYWDSSALLKLYILEPDTPYFLQLVAGTDDQILTSTIAAIEILCATYRKESAGDLKPGGAAAAFDKYLDDVRLGRIIEIPFGKDVVDEARKLLKHGYGSHRRILIRSLDIIHVASAKVSGTKLVVATDTRLRDAASHANMKVLP
jgi:predicted nucleic acid-binding protein